MADVLMFNPPTKHGTAIVRDNLYGCWCVGKANYMWPPLALAQVAAVIEQEGVSVEIMDAMAAKNTFKETVKLAKKADPKYLILNTATDAFHNDTEIVSLIKEELPNMKSVFGGTHVTVDPARSLENPAVDYVILGELEYPSRDLVAGKKPEEIKGLAFKKGKKVVNNGRAPLIENLDELPFPARHLIPDLDYFNPLARRMPYTTMNSSRGCPYRCIYCGSLALYGLRFRGRSPGSVGEEIQECVDKFGIKEVFFRDEMLTLDKKRTLGICKEISDRKLDITWMCNSRVDSIDRETMQAMKKTGCHLIKYGVESGSQKMLDTLRKDITLKQTRDTFKLMHQVGMDSVAHVMIGSPGETNETIRQTIDFIKEIDPTYASFNLTTPYPGTELFEKYKDKIKIKDFSSYNIEKAHQEALFNEAWCGLTKQELEQWFNRAHEEFYYRPTYMIRHLLRQKSPDQLWRTILGGLHFIKFTITQRSSEKRPTSCELHIEEPKDSNI